MQHNCVLDIVTSSPQCLFATEPNIACGALVDLYILSSVSLKSININFLSDQDIENEIAKLKTLQDKSVVFSQLLSMCGVILYKLKELSDDTALGVVEKNIHFLLSVIEGLNHIVSTSQRDDIVMKCRQRVLLLSNAGMKLKSYYLPTSSVGFAPLA